MKCFGMVLGLCLTLAAAGCGSDEAPSGGGVAIIDLDLVAKRLGRDVQMTEVIQQRQTNLNQQLAVVQTSFEQQLNDKKAEFGEEPAEQDAQQLLNMQREAILKLNGVRQQAQGNIAQFQQAVINQFREEAKPIARQVAAEKGCPIVLTKNDTVVFAFDSVLDITEDVISRMSATAPKTLQPAPQPAAAAQQATKPATTSTPAPQSSSTTAKPASSSPESN